MGLPFNNAELEQALKHLPYWTRSGSAIERTFQFDDFSNAMKFVNHIAALAEELNHHPDIHISFNKVKLVLTSHDSGGVTQRDVNLATRITKLVSTEEF